MAHARIRATIRNQGIEPALLASKFVRTTIRPDYGRLRQFLRKVRYGISPTWNCIQVRIDLLDRDKALIGRISARGLILRRISLSLGISELLAARGGRVHCLGKVSFLCQEDYKATVSGALLGDLVGLDPIDYQDVGRVISRIRHGEGDGSQSPWR